LKKFEEVCSAKLITAEEDLEDITEEIWSTLGELKGC
jgi:hypothetical protein